MSKLAQVGKKFRSKFRLIDGREFYGQILDIPDTSRVSNFLSARRYLRTSPNTIVQPGQVAIINSVKYIIAAHGEGFYVDPLYKHFKLFQVDLELSWTSNSEMEDPVTGQKKIVRDEIEGTVYLSTQPKSSQTDMLHIPSPQHLAVCDKAPQLNDLVGDMLVTKSDPALGVTVLELKDQ